MIDVPLIVLSFLLLGMLLVFGDLFRALSRGQLAAPRQFGKRLTVEVHILALAVVLPILSPAITLYLMGIRPGQEVSLKNVEAQTIANVFVTGVLLLTMAASRKNRLVDYGIAGGEWIDEMRCGALGFLASVPPVLAILLLTQYLRTPETEHPFLRLLQSNSSNRAIIEITLAAVIAAPLAEELVYRVILQGILESLAPPSVAIFLPAILFASVHGYPDALPLFPLAIALGIVFHLRRSYLAVVVLHALFNAANLIVAIGSQQSGGH